MEQIQNIAYIVASILFIIGIKFLSHADTARKGNQLSSIGMLIAVIATVASKDLANNWVYILISLVIGGGIGLVIAKRVAMTAMPEMVALFNGFGGLASLLVSWAEFYKISVDDHSSLSTFLIIAISLAIFIGAITFTGSMYAWGKLSGRLSGKARIFPLQKTINLLVALSILSVSVYLAFSPDTSLGFELLILLSVLSLLLGLLTVMPIGGGDMPVVISLLNSCSGLAASAAGFVIMNNVLIVAGCLVGCSGLILTIIMCKAMNRSLSDVLFSGFGSSTQSVSEVEGEMKALSVEDAYFVLEAAVNVLFVPGYGMAVAQAQHVVKELAEILEENGAEVRFAIHPVAGRMPGHMNVLLAEADVPYEQLCEMDAVNPTMDLVDVAIVIGANDVVNPAANTDEDSPIYGMPIINVHQAKTVFALKRGKGAGFSGLVNKLFFMENTRMIYGDAKATISSMVAQFKEG